MLNLRPFPKAKDFERTKMKKFMLFWLIGSVVGLYTTFVIESLWNWFATSALHVSEISFWVTYGLVLLIGLFTDNQGQNFAEDQRWKVMLITLDACIPDAKRDDVKAQMEEQAQVGIWVEAGSHVFGKLVGNSLVLILAFVIHAFLA